MSKEIIEMATRQPYELSPTQIAVGGNVSVLWGAMSNTGTAVFVGLVVTVMGFAMNWYFKHDERKRAVSQQEFENRLKLELHQTQMDKLKGKNHDT